MDPTRIASFDLASFDPAPSRPQRRRTSPPGATTREPTPATPAPLEPVAPDTAELREAVASLARQLGQAQAANAVLAKRLDDLADEPRRAALREAGALHFIASRF